MTGESKGKAFELRVQELLENLREKYPDRIELQYEPQIGLQNGQTVKPDFDLGYKLSHAWVHQLIECQHRKRSSPAIAYKIRGIKATSSRNIFIFTYPESIPNATKNALETDGVLCRSFDELTIHIERLAADLGLIHAAESLATRLESAELQHISEELVQVISNGDHAQLLRQMLDATAVYHRTYTQWHEHKNDCL